MIKNNQSESKPAEPRKGNKVGQCWNEDPQTQALRVEFKNGNFFVFPFSHFVFAEFTQADEGDLLKLAFSTHEVRVHGQRLRSIALAFQKLAVESIKEVPERYAALAGGNEALVRSIEVSEIE